MSVFGALFGGVVATVFGACVKKWFDTRATVLPKADLKHERTLQNFEDGVRAVGDVAIGAGVDTATVEANTTVAAEPTATAKPAVTGSRPEPPG